MCSILLIVYNLKHIVLFIIVLIIVFVCTFFFKVKIFFIIINYNSIIFNIYIIIKYINIRRASTIVELVRTYV